MESDVAILQLDKWLPGIEETKSIQISAGITILQALENQGFLFKQPVIALVNGQTCDITYCLQPGDVVRFLPQIAGG